MLKAEIGKVTDSATIRCTRRNVVEINDRQESTDIVGVFWLHLEISSLLKDSCLDFKRADALSRGSDIEPADIVNKMSSIY